MEDEVRSYFGMRANYRPAEWKGILRFFLNNKPYFFNGFWIRLLAGKPDDCAQR